MLVVAHNIRNGASAYSKLLILAAKGVAKDRFTYPRVCEIKMDKTYVNGRFWVTINENGRLPAQLCCFLICSSFEIVNFSVQIPVFRL